MWLASVSVWKREANLATERWGGGQLRKATRAAAELLEGLGDPGVERGFRMVATLCVHRAVNDEELSVCGASRASFLAGPAVEELWATPGFPALPVTAQPCVQGVMSRHSIGGGRYALLPGSCGACPPCLARLAHDEAREAAARP